MIDLAALPIVMALDAEMIIALCSQF